MASKETASKPYTPKIVDELLDELASFLYDAYKHSKDSADDKIRIEKGQNADDEGNTR